jgi:glycosyltransferase involved in cell wall biosynthesis
MASEKIKIVYFTRKPRHLGNFSIESYFANIKENLPPEFISEWVEMPYYSNGFFKRLANAVYCYFRQGDINHITGDIHYVATFLHKSKTILTVHDCGLLHETQGLKHAIFKYFWFTMPVSRVACVTAVSTATKNDIVRYTQCSPDKILVIHTCIPSYFIREPASFNESNPRIFQIGTAANKNIRRLIPALKGISCTLVIIGKVSEEMKILIRENELSVELIEHRLEDREMLEQYNQCDILAMVSTLEGFGMPIIEANTVGRVVIAGNNSSMPEIAGDAALLVDATNVNDIRNGIITLIQNQQLRERLIENGYRNATRFSARVLSLKYAKLYHGMVKP